MIPIIDEANRTIRYVEFNAAGEAVAENTHTGPSLREDGSSRSEEDYFSEVAASSAGVGRTIARLCNHDSCNGPNLLDIEDRGVNLADLPGVELWDAATMERAFLVVTDEREKESVQRTIRFESGQWTEDTKRADLVILKDTNKVVVRPSSDD